MATNLLSTLPAADLVAWTGRSKISSPADGVVLLTDTAGSAFTRLSLGGVTSSFPALVRSSAALHAKLADDSAFAAFQAGATTLDSLGTSGVATFTAGTLGTAYQPIILDTNDPAAPYFGFAVKSFAGENGATTRNNVLQYGWNLNASGARVDTGLPAFGFVLEADYTTPATVRQIEQYFSITAADGSAYRPFGHVFQYADETIIGTWRCDNVSFGSKDYLRDWLTIYSPTSGALDMQFNSGFASRINYLGTTEDFIQKSGNGVLGVDSSNRLRVGGSYAEIGFGEGTDTLAASVNLKIGSRSRANYGLMRWNHSTLRWEFGLSSGTYRPFGVSSLATENISGTLGNTAGDYVELGYVAGASKYPTVVTVVLHTGGNPGSAQTYTVMRPSNSVPGTSWVQVLPAYSLNAQNFALDIRKGSSDRLELRVRRVSAGSGAIAFVGTVIVHGDQPWTAQAGTGASATSTGIYGVSVSPARQISSVKTGAYTATEQDNTILCDAAAGTFTVTLPAAASLPGHIYTVKKTTAANTVTVDGNSSETIDGATTVDLTTQYSGIVIQSDAANWHVIGSF